jgi:hypothetical protein
LEIKKFLEYVLYQGELGLSQDLARVFHKKSYYSRDRDSQIIFDVVLELRRKGASSPFLIWVWECKDYKKLVPVDDIEEFHSKLEQIGVHKTKGTVASRNGFQKSAIAIARAKGIGLLRLLLNGTVIRLLESIRHITSESIEYCLSQPETYKLASMVYAITSLGQPIEDFNDFIMLEIGDSFQSEA